MQNRYTKIFLAITLTLSLIISAPLMSLAHSGRTDANGGHKDNKNASGLGSYHYHCGGYPAHLHPNGVCPYATKPAPEVKTTPVNTTPAPSVKQEASTVRIGIIINGEAVVFTESSGFPFTDAANRTQVPFRQTMESFGCQVSWDQAGQTAIAEKDGIVVKVPVGLNYVFKDDVQILTDTAAQSRNNRIYLPIRAVLEAFGASVSWDSTSQSVIVTTAPSNL